MFKKTFDKIKKHIPNSLNELEDYFEFAKNVLDEVIKIRDKANAADYARVVFATYEHYTNIFSNDDPWLMFHSDKWTPIAKGSMNTLGEIIYSIITETPSKITLLISHEDSSAFSVTVDDVDFGWVIFDGRLQSLYVATKNINNYKEVLQKTFWNKFKNGTQIVLFFNSLVNKVSATEDVRALDFLPSDRSNLICESLKKYFENGINRSVLLYGPPGSGKSNLVRNITSALKLRSVRITNGSFSNMPVDFLLDFFNIFAPEAIIIEDVDGFPVADLSGLLDKLEQINKHQKLILATANQVGDLDEALIRPGRFDEPIEIKTLDSNIVHHLIQNDSDVFEIVKEWPAAYITELSKRIKVLGKEKALETISDLKDRLNNASYINYTLKTDEELVSNENV